MQRINRYATRAAYTIANGANVSPAIPYAEYSGLALHVTSGLNGLTATVQSMLTDGTFVSTGVSITLATGWNHFTADQLTTLFAHECLRLSLSSGATADSVLTVTRKA